jgi:hypothetical protein
MRDLLLRGLGLAALAAFTSLRRQIVGLMGARGVSPAVEQLRRVDRLHGSERLRVLPTLFWWDASDVALKRVVTAGQLCAVALALGIAPAPSALGIAVVELSVIGVGGDFMAFQWESLLVEAAWTGALVAPWRLRLRGDRRRVSDMDVALLRALLVRLYLQSGLVKLRARDRAWVSLEAMQSYYETAPLPTRLGWHAHQLPPRLHRACTAAALAIECGAPLLCVGSRRMRAVGFGAVTTLQLLIALTGNYGFFNLLALALGLAALDDSLLPRALRPRVRAAQPPLWPRVLLGGTGLLAMNAVALPTLLRLLGVDIPSRPRWLSKLQAWLRPFQVGTGYGPFSQMTHVRPELTIEGTDDGLTWRPYTFGHKVDDVHRAPQWVAPHQPRLDWLMWFAALDPVPPWFYALLQRLLEGEPEVLGLFAVNPFPAHPPRQVRVQLHQYRMTTRAERRATGAWWKRELRREVLPPVSLTALQR